MNKRTYTSFTMPDDGDYSSMLDFFALFWLSDGSYEVMLF